MKSKSRLLNSLSAAMACGFSFVLSHADAQTFVWTHPDTDGDWPTDSNWDSPPAFGADVTLDFSTLDLLEENLMYMDDDVTVGTLLFGDTDPSHDWILVPGFATTLTLATTTGNPGIDVTNRSATLEPVLAGSQGFGKTGAGTLILTGTNTFEGPLVLHEGVVSIDMDTRLGAVPASAAADSLSFDGGTLRITAGNQTIHANRGITVSSNGGFIDTSGLPDTSNNSLTIAGPISGSTALELLCNGDLSAGGGSSNTRMQITNAGNSAFTGGFVIQSGIVEFSGQDAIGSGPLTFSDGGGLVTAAADRSFSNEISVSTGGGTLRCWGGRVLTLTGELTGSGALSKTDGGTAVLTGANTGFTGGVTIGGGTLTLGNGGASGGLGSGAVVNNSTLRTNRSDSFTLANDISGSGRILSDGTGTTTLTGALTSTGVIGVANNGTLVIDNAATNVGTTSLSGSDTNITGSLQVLAGDVNTRVLNLNSGTSSISGGSITTLNALRIGNTSSPNAAVLDQTGGDITVNNAATYLADQNGTGTHNLSGGTHTQAGGTTYLIATRGTGTLNLSGSGLLDTAVLWFGHNSVSGVSATVNLDGGTLQADRIEKPGNVATSIFNFNGGILRAGADNEYFLGGNNGSTAFAGITRANVRDGGARIDTNGFSVTVRQALLLSDVGGDLGTGGLVKQGDGTLTLTAANTYEGPTMVDAGALLVDGSLANGAVQIAADAVLGGNGSVGGDVHVLAGGGLSASVSDWAGGAGSGFTDLDIAGSLTFDGTSHSIVVRTDGISNFSESAKTFPIVRATGGISGFDSGDFNVSAPGFPGSGTWSVQQSGDTLELVYSAAAGYAGWIAGFGLAGPDAGFDFDHDHDGLANGVEFVLGGNPATGSDPGILPTIERVNTDLGAGPQEYLLFTYRRTDVSHASVVSGAEYGTDLVSWTTAVDGVDGVRVFVDDNHVFTPPSADTDRVRVYVPCGSHTGLFGRLHVTQP